MCVCIKTHISCFPKHQLFSYQTLSLPKPKKMNTITSFLLTLLLITSLSSLSLSARTGSDGPFSAELKRSNKDPAPGSNNNNNNNGGGFGGFFEPGTGFNIPGFGKGGIGGGFGYGYGGPSGGSSKGGIVRPTVVCKERGPCYKKKLTCPAKCFTSFSRSGKGYGSGGGGGGCTMDCKKKCVAYC